MRILIADDDPISCLMLRRTLEGWGYNVTAVSNGTDALEIALSKEAPPLVILDWMMPDMDGPDVIRRLRAHKESAYTYAILLTARTNRDDVIEGLDAGADDYLPKPFDMGELRARLRAGQRILDLQQRLLAVQEELRQQASQDHLTRLPNRRSILEQLQKDADRCQRDGLPLGVLLLDLDHFKQVNDTYGHGAGDVVLQAAAHRMRSHLRSYDTVGRFGGEEFLLVLPGAERDGLVAVAERLRRSLGDTPVSTSSRTIHFTCSIGAALRTPGDLIDGPALIQLADIALYRSKAAGRNLVTAAWEISEPL